MERTEYDPLEATRDAVFLEFAGNDQLLALGFSYANIESERQPCVCRLDRHEDLLLLTWSTPHGAGRGTTTHQRLHVSAHGPRIDACGTLHRNVLETAYRVLTQTRWRTSCVHSIAPSKPVVHRQIDNHLVSVGFDVRSPEV